MLLVVHGSFIKKGSNMKIVLLLTLIFSGITANAAYVPTPFAVSKGGQGNATLSAHGVILGNGTSPVNVTATGATNTLLHGNSGADPTYSDIVNADVDAAAAIAYSKLNLAASIVNADIAAGAAIAFSKLAALTSGNILVGNGSNVATSVALSGDATLANTGALTLATVNGNVGSFTNANITVNAKGLITAASSGSSPSLTVTNGGDAAYTILSTDNVVRTGTTLTAQRAYTLPACAGGNIGEHHYIKDTPAQTFNIVLTAAGSDKIDGASTQTLNPGDDLEVVCGASAVWDLL